MLFLGQPPGRARQTRRPCMRSPRSSLRCEVDLIQTFDEEVKGMSTVVSAERFTEGSPLLKARAAGALWLAVIAAGVLGVVVESKLVVRGDAALTAANILASESLFRIG